MNPGTETPAQVRAWPLRARTQWLLRRFSLRPRKSLGQSFLVNEGAARRLAEVAARPGLPLVEIGGGLGALTVPLAESGWPLAVVEIDAALVEALRWLLGDLGHVRVVPGDALELDWGSLAPRPAVAVGNLPYLSAGAILQRLWDPAAPFTEMVVTVQREVAQRLRAQPGTRQWGPLSVLAQVHAERAQVLSELGPGSFLPPPQVSSTALRLVKRSEPLVAPGEGGRLDLALRAAFGTRRKTLAASLRAVQKLSREQAVSVLQRAGLDPQRRGETLDLDELNALGTALQAEIVE